MEINQTIKQNYLPTYLPAHLLIQRNEVMERILREYSNSHPQE